MRACLNAGCQEKLFPWGIDSHSSVCKHASAEYFLCGQSTSIYALTKHLKKDCDVTCTETTDKLFGRQFSCMPPGNHSLKLSGDNSAMFIDGIVVMFRVTLNGYQLGIVNTDRNERLVSVLYVTATEGRH